MTQQVVIVTGGSCGIGRLTAQAFAGRSARVYAASRTEPLGFAADNIRWLPMDVRDADAVRAAVRQVLAECGRVDVLVNNAGVTVGALVEETGVDAARALFDTDFWGACAATAAVLPAMRAQGGGQLVFVGSLAGRVGAPGQGFYAAAKSALAGYAQSLAAEVAAFGIRVNLVEPGFHRTQLGQHMAGGDLRVADYDPVRELVQRRTREQIAGGDDPVHVARAIERLVRDRDARVRHPVGRDATWVPRIQQLVPARLFQAVLRRRFGLP